MQRLHHIFQRAALALALLTTGIAGGYALHEPAAAYARPCPVASTDRETAAAASRQVYVALWTDALASANAAHSACSCGSA